VEHCSLLLLVACAEDTAPNDGASMVVMPDDTVNPSPTGSSEGTPPTNAPSGDDSVPGPAATPPGLGPVVPPTGSPTLVPIDPPVGTPGSTPVPVEPNPEPQPLGTAGAAPTVLPVGGAGPVASGGAAGEAMGGGGTAGAGTGGAAPMNGVCPASPGTAPSGMIAASLVAGVEPEDTNYHLFEGAAWLGDAVYFSDINPNPWNSTIRKYVPATGMVTNFLVDAASNGLAVSSDGVLFSATAGKKQITRYGSDGGEEVAVPGPFNSPNDIAIAADGTIYFTDPQQGELAAGNLPQVVHVVKDGVDAVFSQEIMTPNGVTLSPDDSILYVSGGGFTGFVKKVTLVDGLAGAIEDFATGLQVPDGMGIDCAGNLYVVLHEPQQVAVYEPGGMQIATITLGNAANGQAGKPTNVAFGGADRQTLYVTAAYSLWEVPLQIAGFPN
jgi:gluconolactonase